LIANAHQIITDVQVNCKLCVSLCIISFVVIFDLFKLFNVHIYCSFAKWCNCNSATFCSSSRYYFLYYVFKCAL